MDADKGEEFGLMPPMRDEEDITRLAVLKGALESMIGARVAVVDAWGVTYFERFSVPDLTHMYKLIRRLNDVARPRLVVPSELFQRVVQDRGIGRLFDIYDDLKTAMRALESHN